MRNEKMRKKAIAFGLAAVLMLGNGLPVGNDMRIVRADTIKEGNFTITGSNLTSSDYSYSDHTLHILSSKAMTISGTTTTDTIAIDSGANITLSNLSMKLQGNQVGRSAIEIKDDLDATVNIQISGSNTIESWYAGIEKSGTKGKLILSGVNGNKDTLKAYGQNKCAGIGSENGKDTANITILNGTYDIMGGQDAAGLGSGSGGGASNIVIEDGIIDAVSMGGGAGIGSGKQDESSAKTADGIYIHGGTIRPCQFPSTNRSSTMSTGAAIGGGSYSTGRNIEITGGEISIDMRDIVSYIGGAGIGGGAYADGENITISGGSITMFDALYYEVFAHGAAGIGGGYNGDGTNITISAGNHTIYSGSWGAGIGGGYAKIVDKKIVKGFGKNIKISGGNLKVTANKCSHSSKHSGAAIGDGGWDVNDSITVAKGEGSTIAITGGTIYAVSGEGAAAIGGSYGRNSTVYISGGSINAVPWKEKGTSQAQGIGSGENGATSIVAYSADAASTKVSLYTGEGSTGYTKLQKVTPTFKKNGSAYSKYGTNDIYADENGKIYLYLEDGVTVDKVCMHKQTTVVNKKAATCIAEGYSGDTKCTDCGEIVSKGSVIAKTSHSPLSKWASDETNHWKNCSQSGCDAIISLATHTNKTIVDVKPTENSAGEQHDECTICGYKQKSVVISKLDHVHKGTKIAAVAATCEKKGNIEYYKCTGCGDLFSDSACLKSISQSDTEIAALGHSYANSWSSDSSSHWKKCTRTGCTSIHEKDQHVFEMVVDKEPTETTTGLAHEECSICFYKKDSVTLPKSDHLHIGNKVAAVAATCEKAGNDEYYLCRCGIAFSDAACTMSIDPSKTYIAALGHLYATSWTSDSSGHWKVCMREGCNSVGEKSQHTMKTVVDKEPTQTTTGIAHDECTTCGFKKTEVELPVKEHVHVLTRVAAVVATCEKAGNIEYYECATCDKLFEDVECTKLITQKQTVVSALGHSYSSDWTTDTTNHWKKCTRNGCSSLKDEDKHSFVTVIDKEATETEAGQKHDECSVCHMKKESQVIPVKNHVHNMIKVAGVEATCEKAGNIEYYKCNCGGIFLDQEGTKSITVPETELKALGHIYADKWSNNATTHWKVCTRENCGDKLFEEEHSFILVVDKKADHENQGMQHEECSKCGYKKSSVTIPALGHNASLVSAVAATCTTTGIMEHYSCSCGKLFRDAACTKAITESQTVVDMLGHKYEDGWSGDAVSHWKKCTRTGCDAIMSVELHENKTVIEKEATENEEGKQHDECAICGYKQASVTIPKTDHVHVLTKVTAVEPTCEKAGSIEYYKCSCGNLFEDSAGLKIITAAQTVRKALGHNYSNVWSIDENSHWKICTRTGCGAQQKAENHSFETMIDVEATHDRNGLQHEECSICSYKKKAVATSKIPHEGVKVAAKAATCTMKGNIEYYICSCGQYFSDSKCTKTITKEETVIDALGHAYSDKWSSDARYHWKACTRSGCDEKLAATIHTNQVVIEKEPTQDSEGKQHEECIVCGFKQESVTVQKLSHKHSGTKQKAVEATCEKDGNIEYYKCSCGSLFEDANCTQYITLAQTVEPAKGHAFSDDWSSNGTSHWRQCTRTNCGVKDYVEDHVIKVVIDQEATHEADGLQHEECSICSFVKSVEIIEKIPHKGIKKVAQDATCVEDGNREYYVCGCGKKFTDSKCIHELNAKLEQYFVKIPAMGHAYSEVWSYDESSHWKECIRTGCGAQTSVSEHSFMVVVDRKPTLEEAGIQHEECMVCHYRKPAEEVGMHTHDNMIAHKEIPATCKITGKKAYYECSCGKLFEDEAGTRELLEKDLVIPKKEHSFGAWSIVTPATNTKDGLRKHICSVCGEEQTDVILKGTQNDAANTVVVAKQNQILEDLNYQIKLKVLDPGKYVNGKVTGAKVEFVSSNTNATKVVIPSTVSIYGVEYLVTSINKSAFKNNKKITSVTIGENINAIGTGMFSGCTKLKKVSGGKNVTTIASKAFYKCNSLTSVTIPSKVTKIGKSAFEGCTKLKKITIKSSKLKKVEKNAIKGISKKAMIKVPKKQLEKYKKLFKKKTGFNNTMKIKK